MSLIRETMRILKIMSGRYAIHTYKHNWPLQLFSQDYGLASNTTLNFMGDWRDLRRLQTTDF